MTARPATSMPPGTSAPTLGPMGGVCKLDAYSGADTVGVTKLFASLREAVKKNFGVSDAEIDEMLAQTGDRVAVGAAAASNRAFGDLSQCAAVKTNKVVGMLQIGVTGLVLATTAFLMWRGGRAPRVHRALEVLGALGVGLTAFQMRHALNLVSKVTWHGSGPNTRRMLVLTAVGAVVSVALAYFKDTAASVVVVSLLAAMAAVTAVKMYFMARAVSNPEATYLVAIASAVDRMLPHKKIAEARRQYTAARTRTSGPPRTA